MALCFEDNFILAIASSTDVASDSKCYNFYNKYNPAKNKSTPKNRKKPLKQLILIKL